LHPIVPELDQVVRVEPGEAIPHRPRRLIGQRGENVLDGDWTGSLDELPKHRAQYVRLRGVAPGRPPGLEPGIRELLRRLDLDHGRPSSLRVTTQAEPRSARGDDPVVER